jgi:hypothetical protein
MRVKRIRRLLWHGGGPRGERNESNHVLLGATLPRQRRALAQLRCIAGRAVTPNVRRQPHPFRQDSHHEFLAFLYFAIIGLR